MRPLTRAQAQQNRAFLKLLRRTGNVRLACRELGLKYGTMQHRRRVHPGFAVRVEAALVFSAAGLTKKYVKKGLGHGSESHDRVGRVRLTLGSPPHRPVLNSSSRCFGDASASAARRSVFRTHGGEPVLRRTRNGKLQMQRAQAGKLTPAAEQAYLAALCATCNKALAAAAVGAAGNAFARRRRNDPAFAREERLALREGYEALELGLLESLAPESHEHDDWRSNEPPAMPPMSVNQALQLMYLHQKEARLNAVEPHEIRRRAREPEAAYHERLVRMAEERLRRQREEFAVAEAERWERGEPAWGPAGEAVRAELGLEREEASRGVNPRDVDPLGLTAGGRPGLAGSARNDARSAPLTLRSAASALPDLAQVTGWSRADPKKVAHHAGRALFGGWRMEHLRAKEDGSRE